MSDVKQRGLGRDFWWFRGGEFLSELGGYAQTLAIAWWVLELTDSAASMSMVLVLKLITGLMSAPC